MYENLSLYYDTFMQEVPYDEWADFLALVIGDRKKGFDVGCGSGNLTLPLAERGYEITGSDVSAEMLSVFASRLANAGKSIPLVLQSAERLDCGEKQDFITANCDVVNYISRPIKFFARAYNNLNDNGVLVFDVSSEYKLREILANNVFTEEREDVTYVWENYLNRKSVDMFLTFFAPDGNGKYEKSVDEQTQFIYSEEELKKMLYEVGFTKVKTCGFLKSSKPKKREERIHFIAYK